MSYVAIDPTAVATLASSLEEAADAADTRRAAVDRTLRSCGHAAAAPARVGAVSSSLRDSAADLRRRLRELSALTVLYRHTGEQGPVYPRPHTTFATFAEADEAGRRLAGRFTDLFQGGDPWHQDQVAPLLADLAEHADDARFCAALFGTMDPRIGTWWANQVAHLAVPWNGLPYDAPATFYRAMSTGLNAPGQDALLASYLGPITHMLMPVQVRDVLRYGDYSDAVTLRLVRSAVDRAVLGVRDFQLADDEPGLLDALLRSPSLAQAFVQGLPEKTFRELLGTGDPVLGGFGDVVGLAGAGSDEESERLVGRLLVAIGADGTHVATAVRPGIAEVFGAHLDRLGWAVAHSLYPEGLRQEDLVRAFVRVMDDSPAAFAALHQAGADLTPALLAQHDALSATSPSMATLGAVYGLLARADADSAIGRANGRAGWWAMASTGLSLVPLPGPALAGAVVKKTFDAVLSSQADAAKAHGVSEAADLVDGARGEGRLLLAVSVWQYDAALHGGVSALAPPAELRHADGTLKSFGELRSPAEQDAYARWLATPTPRTLPDIEGRHPATLDELVNLVDDEWRDGFDKVVVRP
jgi:hypothetical protein